MFEDSLVSSRQHFISPGKRWITVASFTIQLLLVATVILVPMLRPEMLPMLSPPSALVILPKPLSPLVVKPADMPQTTSDSSVLHLPSVVRVETIRGSLPSRMPTALGTDGPASLAAGYGMGDSFSGGLALLGSGDLAGPRVTAASEQSSSKPRISAGVSAGMLLKPIQPVYPAIARSAHIEGTVVVTATIDRTGHIIGLQVISGPAMLRGAAVDAVRDARYRPFLLNGEPTEVETTISVNFRMGS